jgi:hypothetical protein
VNAHAEARRSRRRRFKQEEKIQCRRFEEEEG